MADSKDNRFDDLNDAIKRFDLEDELELRFKRYKYLKGELDDALSKDVPILQRARWLNDVFLKFESERKPIVEITFQLERLNSRKINRH